MEIYQLKTFVAVAHLGSITRASEQLYLSQPAVSAHIKAIEDTYGLSLFMRTARGMTLTSDGQRLLAKAEQTLVAHRNLIKEATNITGQLTGKLQLGIGSNSCAGVIGRLLTALSGHYPDLEIALCHGSSSEIVSGIQNGNLDAGFYNATGEPCSDMETKEVAQFGIYLASPPGFVEITDPPKWQDLATFPWICAPEHTCCGRAAEMLFKAHNFRPKQIISIDRENPARNLIASGVGLGLLHGETAKEAEAGKEVELICEAEKAMSVLFAHLVSRAEDPLLIALKSMLRVEKPMDIPGNS